MTQDRPTAPELLDALFAFITDDVTPALSGRVRFHARVAANVVAMLRREWELGPEHAAADAAGLARLVGHRGEPRVLEAELARAIRGGELDPRMSEVVAFLRESARRKLEIANPGYLR
ncbi:MAG: hypothetical protein E6J14_06995 [Chloroflexi bacterium]|nr:MAG: hypothetical protein E6J14_06995 [Chloroflexota bacterium]